MFSNPICLGLMENLDKTAAVEVLAPFMTPEHVDSRSMF